MSLYKSEKAVEMGKRRGKDGDVCEVTNEKMKLAHWGE
jgi:hypothetical protein